MASVPTFVKNEIRKTTIISAEFCLKLGWFRLEKNGGGGIKSPPAGFCFAKSFCFPAADRQEISNPKAHLSRRPFVGKSPQNEGAEGRGIWGTPVSGRSARVLAVGRAVSRCLSLGRAGGTGPGGRFAPSAPSPSLAVAAPGSRRRGGAAPRDFKGESVFSSSPTPHQRIKKIKTQPRKRFCVFSRLSCGAEAPKSSLAALRRPPKPHPAAPSAQTCAEPIPLYSPFAFHWEK